MAAGAGLGAAAAARARHGTGKVWRAGGARTLLRSGRPGPPPMAPSRPVAASAAMGALVGSLAAR
jgi:hypothetical protein